ncbi:inner-membrane translocator [Candidatus Vecturithrix granuli]|uniref:Inner-membrane translocator n=1 Tax=Vecturithrix granuli TaxID=1499967 RepID=A0A0S6W9N6_VECG1|nr:inner-membrane translocator [Candidatus Vecturithrix granuli]
MGGIMEQEGQQGSPEAPGGKLTNIIRKFEGFREGTLILIIIFVCVVMSFASPYFLTWPSIKAILLSFSTEGIVVVGMTIMLIVGGIDLSVGAVMALSMVIAGKLFLLGLNPWIASLVSIMICGLIGAAIGLFVTQLGLSHFITTLAFMGIARGACYVITEGTPLSLYTLPPSFKFIGQGNIFKNLPFVIVIFFIIVIISDYFLRNSTLLRKVFYTGSNEKAAMYSGINVSKVKIAVAMLCSSLTGLAGIIFMSKFGAATANFGTGLELTAISAAVIGGASLTGGEGTVFGSILGIGLVATITGSMILMDVSVYWQELIRGCILLTAVSLDHLRHHKK